jgi:DNA-binding FadR family transcriptional regulator
VVSLPDHRKVMDAIASRNESAARFAMQRLINYSQERAGVVLVKRGGELRPANGRVKIQNR